MSADITHLEITRKEEDINTKLLKKLVEAAEDARDWISSYKQNMTCEEKEIVKKLDNILNKITVDSKLTNEMRILQEFACEFHPINNTKEIYNYNYRELVQIVKEIVEEM